MGNSASSLPYSIGPQVGETEDGCWAVHDGTQKSDQAPVTVFQAQKPALAKEGFRGGPSGLFKIFVAHQHFVTSKKLRHPNILQVLATLDTDAPNNEDTAAAATNTQAMATTGAYIIVTEPCKPLQQWLREDTPNHDQLAWGLQGMIQSLSFLHSGAQLAHGNVSPQSFWVSPSGDVKLWNFSLVTPVGVADGGGGPTHHFRDYEGILTPQAYRSPERVKGQWEGVATSQVHCMDSYGLGILINDYFNGRIPGPLQKAVQRLQTPSLKMRPRVAPLLRCPVFDTAYSKLLKELEELQIQPVEEKLRFWQQLDMEKMDPSVASHKLLPLIQLTIKTICSSDAMVGQDLYRREVFAMLGPLFYIAENFLESNEQVGKELTPLVNLLFAVKDRGVRGALLGKTPLFACSLSQSDLNTLVFEPLCSGFADSSDALRELTLKATGVLVPHLYPPNVEKLSRYLVRLQSDTSPSIRTHTMTLIPKLSPHLSDQARQKLLLPAFTRAFKDPHPPSRLAALQAVVNCEEYFSLEDLATKVLPACMPLALDGVGDVRSECFKVVDEFLAKLKEEHEARSFGDVGAGTVQTAAQHNLAVPPPAAPSSGSYLGGLSNWYSTSAADVQPAAKPAGPSTTTNSHAPTAAPATKPTPSFSSLNIGGDAGATSDDGWDDDDDDLDLGGGVDDDVFASIGTSKPKSGGKLIMKRSGGGGGGSTLMKPKKVEVKKLDVDDDEEDGWDDF